MPQDPQWQEKRLKKTIFLDFFCQNACILKKSTTFAPLNAKRFLRKAICPGGGIGRRARFRCVCRKVCGFESRPGHPGKSLTVIRLSGIFTYHNKKKNKYPATGEEFGVWSAD